MLQFFLRVISCLSRDTGRAGRVASEEPGDPLAHPDILAMGERERGDLPFDRKG
ncbi:hypothetical protein J2Z17_002732 [Rhizobium halophytocola]|uniref:Propionyl-coenzyme A carboxylase alpha polypeptide n=1 Tax=Rhizobium halophytocola TaxID=735519 RepID=A0ABS4E030_9HYPH|nr:hypothetical protein [Rhizobium halophytocola]